MQRIGNWYVPTILRSPLHGSMSGSLMLLTYRGRRSGAEHTIAVGYHRGALAAVAAR